MNERERQFKREARKNILIAVAISLLTLIISILTAIWTARFDYHIDHMGKHADLVSAPSAEYLIQSGDHAFRDYKYDVALNRYRDAAGMIESLVKFEDESPSKNPRLSQHYYNMRTLLQVRMELTASAIAISRAEPETRNDN
jgi:hypothetical protein